MYNVIVEICIQTRGVIPELVTCGAYIYEVTVLASVGGKSNVIWQVGQ